MTDLRQTIAPKSDQLNSDDLIGTTKTITVTKVSLCTEPEQPIAINFDGDGGKPYKPCKSMRRVLVNVWGPDGSTYAGRRMTLYRDDKVQFGGLAVGGIRISHVSHIERDVTMALTATRANRKPFTVKPLADERGAAAPAKVTPRKDPNHLTEEEKKVNDGITALCQRIANASHTELEKITADPEVQKQRKWLEKNWPTGAKRVDEAVTAALAIFEAASTADGELGVETTEVAP